MSRREAKQRTRQRLLDAALAILDGEGEPGLTTTKVTRRAGIAQSSFYVHFADIDELLCQLIDQLWDQRLAAAREASAQASPQTAVRELFRATVTRLVAHPAVLRLVVRSRLDPASPLGDYTRRQLAASRWYVVAALAGRSDPDDLPTARRRTLDMQADSLIAMVDALALGHLEGRYPDVEEILDVLVQFTPKTGRPAAATRQRL